MDEWTQTALAARDGDPAALRSFITLTKPDVWRMCAWLADREAADDLSQETYLRVLGALPRYRADAPARAWLFAIVRRVVADELALRRRQQERLGRIAAAAAVRHTGTVADHADAVVLTALLPALDFDRRAAFVLTQLLGYSYDLAAQTCACPVGTIRSRVARAREDLLGMLRADADLSSGTA